MSTLYRVHVCGRDPWGMYVVAESLGEAVTKAEEYLHKSEYVETIKRAGSPVVVAQGEDNVE